MEVSTAPDIKLKSTTTKSLNQRFTEMLSSKQPVQVTIQTAVQPGQEQELEQHDQPAPRARSSSGSSKPGSFPPRANWGNQKLAQEMEKRPSVQAALTLKADSLKQRRLGWPFGSEPRRAAGGWGGPYRGGPSRAGSYHGGPYRAGSYRAGSYHGGPYRAGSYRAGPYHAGHSHGGPYRAGRSHGGPYHAGPSHGGSYRGGSYRAGPSHGGPYRAGPYHGGPSRGSSSRGGSYHAGSYRAGPYHGRPSCGSSSRGGSYRGGPSSGGPYRARPSRGSPSRGGSYRGCPYHRGPFHRGSSGRRASSQAAEARGERRAELVSRSRKQGNGGAQPPHDQEFRQRRSVSPQMSGRKGGVSRGFGWQGSTGHRSHSSIMGRGEGPFGDGGRWRRVVSQVSSTKKQPDDQLNAYKTKTHVQLDAELDAYMAQKNQKSSR